MEAKTGTTSDDFVVLARANGLLEPGVKAGQIVAGVTLIPAYP